MAIKKSDLYSSLWASCDELRGGMDASQYKDYVLFMLFIKYVSDKYANYEGFEAPVVIPKGASFADMVALKGKPDIGDKINKQVIAPLVDANARLARSDFPDFDDPNKLGQGSAKVERLSNLIGIFQDPKLDFAKNRAEHDDILGDAYEYLMRHFATQSGKSKGQFYTPSEVSRVIAKVIGISSQNTKVSTTAYDPTCGSGSLLLKVAAEAGKRITLEGQEKDVTTAGLARMNMILHDFPTANIISADTLHDPKFKDGEQLRTYDYVIANPPFSDKTWSTGLIPSADKYQRFAWGVPPKKQGDYAYLLHIIRSMKSEGKGACILPHGVLFRGGAEAVIRQKLIRSGYLKGIIGLPANLFYGTGIPACIVVLDKENAATRKGIFMIDASKGFRKDGPKNRLREQDIHRIVDTFLREVHENRYSRLVSVEEIADPKNDYNLNLPRYIDSTEPEDLQDIDGHLRGGIPVRDIEAFSADWQQYSGVRSVLFESAGRPGYLRLKLPLTHVKSAILGHPEFEAFQERVTKLFTKWRTALRARLVNFGQEDHPKELIHHVSETLLAAMQAAPILDPYDVYQHLMDYWAATMQDDCYLIANDGWHDAAQPRFIVEDKDKKMKPRPDFTLGKKKYQTELIPPALIIKRWFAAEQMAIEELEAELAALQQQIEALEEEQGGEEGVFFGFDKINRAEIGRRLKEIDEESTGAERRALKVAEEEPVFLYDGELSESRTLLTWLNFDAKTTELSREVKATQEALTEKVAAKYPELTTDEIKRLVVEDKWLATIAAAVQTELDRVSQTLAGRIRQLAERYATSLPQLTEQLAKLSERVDGHLQKIGESKERNSHAITSKKLITGQIRLDGFNKDWQIKPLGSLIRDCFSGATPRRNRPEFYKGSIRWITSGELNYDVITDTIERISPEAVAETNLRMVPAGTFLMAITGLEAEGTRGACAMVGASATTNQSCMAIFPTDELLPQYLFYYYVYRGKSLALQYCQGTKQQSYTAKLVRQLPISLPPSIDEQRAIVEVLADFEAHIATLECLENKSRDLKQAMMQELLTGRIRLVSPPASNPEKPHNWAINEAVIVAVLTKHFGDERFPLGRKRSTKLSYLLHRHVEHAAQGYLKKAAGPYNPAVKYRGPEKIAQENGYIRPHKNGNYAGYIVGNKIAQAEGYFEKWYGSDVIPWLEQFRLKTNDELELLTTVDMAMQDLKTRGDSVNLTMIKEVIHGHPEWERKLSRAAFSDNNIERAIAACEKLFIS